MKYTPEDGFPYYFDLVESNNLETLFASKTTFTFLQSIDEEKAAYRYKPEKWSIKQIVGHITDHERIKMFRAFQLSRNKHIELWGYDQSFLVNNSRFEELSLEILVVDFLTVRNASLSFIETLSEDQLMKTGRARQYEITLKDFLKSIIGHERHHLKVLQEKYF